VQLGTQPARSAFTSAWVSSPRGSHNSSSNCRRCADLCHLNRLSDVTARRTCQEPDTAPLSFAPSSRAALTNLASMLSDGTMAAVAADLLLALERHVLELGAVGEVLSRSIVTHCSRRRHARSSRRRGAGKGRPRFRRGTRCTRLAQSAVELALDRREDDVEAFLEAVGAAAFGIDLGEPAA